MRSRYKVIYKSLTDDYETVYDRDEVLVLDRQENKLKVMCGKDLAEDDRTDSFGVLGYLSNGLYCCEEFGVYVYGMSTMVAYGGAIYNIHLGLVVMGLDMDCGVFFFTDIGNEQLVCYIDRYGNMNKHIRIQYERVGSYRGNAGAAITRYLV